MSVWRIASVTRPSYRRAESAAFPAGCILKSRPTFPEGFAMTVNVRYIVDDVEKAIEFYTGALGFTVAMHPAPGFAALDRGELRLYMNAPGAGGAGATVAGQTPQPGGWNRIQLEVDDLAALHAKLSSEGRK